MAVRHPVLFVMCSSRVRGGAHAQFQGEAVVAMAGMKRFYTEERESSRDFQSQLWLMRTEE